ncbi:MAG: hypothetical protein IT250_16130, partial [Chitinophagaceae bacterium]|nr:hypothetical protein [Chitinophagaceae bacterium]
QTALCKQMLQNGDTRLYFSSPEQKGYINQLDFRANDTRVNTIAHPEHLDIVRLILPEPLLPEGEVMISTPFHVQLPEFFGATGHRGQSYQIAAWYPQPAVYDKKGWHPMPYLQQGKLYSESGNFEVTITVPENYVVSANGVLQNDGEKEWLNTRSTFSWKARRYRKKTKSGSYKTIREDFPPSSPTTKTLQFSQQSITGFTWFADKRHIVNHDTCTLPSGKIIDLYSFYSPAVQQQWSNSIAYMKNAVRFFSAAIGEYPYSSLSITENLAPARSADTYRPLILRSKNTDESYTEKNITTQVGEIWFNTVLASNARMHPWMDEGMTNFFSKKIFAAQNKMLPRNMPDRIAVESVVAIKKDQPVDLPATAFSPANYYVSVYEKTARWMQLLQSTLGKENFDSGISAYFHQWRFRHPYPEDFKQTMTKAGERNMDSIFALLQVNGNLLPAVHKKIRLTWIGNTNHEYPNIGVAPALGYNSYDKLMAGAVVHNYSLPFTKLRFIAAPLYATGSKQLNGIGRLTYTWYPGHRFDHIEAGLSVARFTEDAFTDDDGHTTYLRYSKLSPQLRFRFRNADPLSHLNRFVQLKTHFINTQSLQFTWDSVLMKNLYAVHSKNATFFQLRFVTDNSRALYPYRYTLQVEFSKDFGKITYSGNYFFNYAKGGGLDLRWFGGKFFYLGDNTTQKRFDTDPYHLNLSTPKGDEDYTYDNYFAGRNAYNGFFSQQVMMRDGGFKVRTDLLSNKVGKTDDWLAALNLTSSIHPAAPVKLFLDLGTYDEGWQEESGQPKLLYDAGLQLSLFKEIVNVYVPLVYSKVYRNYYKSTPGNKFLQRISFSIDIQKINFKKINPLLPF